MAAPAWASPCSEPIAAGYGGDPCAQYISPLVLDGVGTSMGPSPFIEVPIGGSVKVSLTAALIPLAQSLSMAAVAATNDEYGLPTGAVLTPAGATAQFTFTPQSHDVGFNFTACAVASAQDEAANPVKDLIVCVKFHVIAHAPVFVGGSPTHGEVLDAYLGEELVALFEIDAQVPSINPPQTLNPEP